MAKRIKPGRRLYLNAKRNKIVESGSPEAAFLYCAGPDNEVDPEEFRQLGGFRLQGFGAAQESKEDKADQEDKELRQAIEDKSTKQTRKPSRKKKTGGGGSGATEE